MGVISNHFSMRRCTTDRFLRFALLSVAVVVVTVSIASPLVAQSAVDGLLARTYVDPHGAKMPYRLFIPREYDPSRSYPLIVFLHGGAGNGADNLQQIIGGNTNGSHMWIRDDVQREHPAFVVAPQALDGETWGGPEAPELSPAASMMIEIVENLQHEFNIDKSRLYLTGQSLGGFGTWDVIIRRPDLFAAAVPLCGSGIVKEFPFRTVYAPTDFKRIKEVPIWVFQGADDADVPPEGPRQTVAALRSIGSKVRYTEYPGVGHRVWEHAYVDPALVAWIFAQHRSP